MQILYSYLKNYWKLLLLSLLLATINQVFSLLDPLIFRHIIDDYATKFDQYTFPQFLRGVGLLLGMAVGVAFVSRVAKNFQDFYVNTITQRLGAKMYADGIKHSLELPYQQFEDERSGETLGKIQKARTDSQELISSVINVIFVTLVGFVFVMIYSIKVYWPIAPLYFLTIPIIGGVSIILSRKIKKVQQMIFAETASLAGATTESLRNIELVKSLGLSDQEIKRLNNATEKILLLELKKVKYVRSLSFVQGTIVNFARTAILFVMLYLIFSQKITFGEFFSLWIYSFWLFQPLQELGKIIGTYRESQASLDNFKNILETPIQEKPKNAILIKEVKSVTFSDVAFQHKSANNEALRGVSFEAHRGETVAFVGPSGSGKTTLVKLLVGLYTPLRGAIKYNNSKHDEIDIDSLRTQIGFVTQDTQLFAGTIRENLLFVNPNATDEMCIEALNKSACQNLLARAQKGLDTLIGEGGVKVSGGEKQRLSIARALLRKPNLLIFDEATSSLDSLTEQEISKTIQSISETREHITILIAHRLSTIMHADRIYVLEKGLVIESGKHNDLIAQKGLYAAMWRQQIGEKQD
ncbi:ABC transporter ATP-binding protein/permease [Candidatus Nomurabacteria bacterium]|nr:ABC transporter ATP-binding protein/permease [Candidatus Nomurabacteria bacterium]